MSLTVISGTSNEPLATLVSKNSNIQLTGADIRRFADGETWCQVQKSVRGNDVFIIQSTSTPVNDNLMELLILVDACKRASPKSITAVIPYFGYARQDRKSMPRVPITAALVAKLIESSGVNRVVAVDLHCGQIQGFFQNIPVDNIFGQPVLARHIIKRFGLEKLNSQTVTIVSPDAGGTERADYFRKCIHDFTDLKCKMAMLNKKREEHNEISQMELIGSVENSFCIIVDDMIDTAGTLCKAAEKLKSAGATEVIAAASHGLFNGPAIQRIENSVLSNVFVLDTITLPKEKQTEKIVQVSVSKLLSSAITHIHKGMSVSEIFDTEN